MKTSVAATIWGLSLTANQKLVLVYLVQQADSGGVSDPSINMICRHCYLSSRTVFKILALLEKKALVFRCPRMGHSSWYTINPELFVLGRVPTIQDALPSCKVYPFKRRVA